VEEETLTQREERRVLWGDVTNLKVLHICLLPLFTLKQSGKIVFKKTPKNKDEIAR
jgi:hypothetical protein